MDLNWTKDNKIVCFVFGENHDVNDVYPSLFTWLLSNTGLS